MAKKKPAAPRGNRVSLAPLTADQAMAALLKVKPADVKKLEAREANAGRIAALRQQLERSNRNHGARSEQSRAIRRELRGLGHQGGVRGGDFG